MSLKLLAAFLMLMRKHFPPSLESSCTVYSGQLHLETGKLIQFGVDLLSELIPCTAEWKSHQIWQRCPQWQLFSFQEQRDTPPAVDSFECVLVVQQFMILSRTSVGCFLYDSLQFDSPCESNKPNTNHFWV